MNRILLLVTALVSMITTNAQTWTKLSTNFDSLWSNSVKYFNKGDTIIYYGSTTGTGALDAKRFYVSTNGGQTFTRDLTALDALGYTPIFGLPINNMIIGFKNVPNDGAYSFQGINNWTSLLPQGLGIYGEVNAGLLLYNAGGGNTTLRTITNTGGSSTVVASGANGIDLICSYNKGNRLFLGGGTNNAIKYVDNGDFNSIQSSTIASQGMGSDVVRFFEAGANLYAVVDASTNKLFKSTDNGLTWSIVNTTYNNGGNTTALTSAFTIGTPNGNIFFLESSTGTSNNVFLSTDGGATAVKIPTGLPSTGIKIGPTVGKILTKGNKVWYQVCAANNVDFVRTDTAIAGLYLFNNPSTDISQHETHLDFITVSPNPSSDFIFIQSEVAIINYQITNALGQSITSAANDHRAIDIRDLENGLYYINLTTADNQLVSKRILKY